MSQVRPRILLVTLAAAACLSNLAGAQQPVLKDSAGNTYHYQATDPLTGANLDSVGIPSDAENNYGVGNGAEFWLMCKGKATLRAFFLLANTFLSDTSVKVQWRFDKGPVQGPEAWLPGAAGDAAYVPSGEERRFIMGMLGASTLVVRVFDDRGTAYTGVFDLTGLSSTFKELPCAGAGG